ncbi:MAG TPA: cyclodeaminase/cyclohydrolase family protein [Chloroflexia bacterium]|nr:cyclodeaminase/cyclohydrolase family protein [Chloroflexia bacterium]
MLAESNLPDFIARLGSSEATPGGGGAAALSGASAAGLVTMVARLTTGKPAFAAIEERLQQIIAQGDRLQSELLGAIDDDALAFEQVMAAYGLPRSTDEEKKTRQATLQPALVGATESPLQIARRCLQVVQMAAELAETGNPQTITDAGTAATLAEAALQGAVFQARVNLKSIKDSAYVTEKKAEIESLLQTAQAARSRALAAVNQKLG